MDRPLGIETEFQHVRHRNEKIAGDHLRLLHTQRTGGQLIHYFALFFPFPLSQYINERRKMQRSRGRGRVMKRSKVKYRPYPLPHYGSLSHNSDLSSSGADGKGVDLNVQFELKFKNYRVFHI